MTPPQVYTGRKKPRLNRVNTNVGKSFYNLVRKHFPKNHQLHKIFNTNTIKHSYSCTPNMQSIITQHNSQLLNGEEKQQHRSCNCRSKPNCPLSGECLTPCIVYKAEVIADGEKSVQLGHVVMCLKHVTITT